MVGQSRKWMILVATTWVQAFTGTNFDFSAYSSELKSVLRISQLQLNYLSVASDLGKAFGWCSGLSLIYFPLPIVLFASALTGFMAYGVQWLLIHSIITLPYALTFLLCMLAGCSICWFNTVCYVLCIKNFTTNRPLALSLTISFNGLSAALYNVIANSINPQNPTLYLFLNAVVPLFASAAALPPIIRQPPQQTLPTDTLRRDSFVFLFLNLLALVTGLYLLLLYPLSTTRVAARIVLSGSVLLLILPLLIPGIAYARRRVSWSNFNSSSFNLVGIDDLELHRELMANESVSSCSSSKRNGFSFSEAVTAKDRVAVLGEEHTPAMLVRRWDFWLYYAAYFCGGTVGLVYSNNIGQISESLGFVAETSSIVSIYSTCSFFGRLLSSLPDFLRDKVYFARTGWLAGALVLTPVAFLWLSLSSTIAALSCGTALLGLSSGFMFAASVSITSELFGPNAIAVNHNILITNIPLGSVLYGLLAAVVYDSNAVGGTMVCIGRGCYMWMFVVWGCVSVLGWVFSVVLFLRTKMAYDMFEENRGQTSLSS